MKNLIKLALLLATPALAQTAPTTLTLSWTNSDASWGPVCPATAPKLCLGPLTASDITSLTPVIMSAAISATATSYVYTFPSTPSFGNHTYSLVASGFDANGNAVTSAAATTVVDVEPKLNAPSITLAVAK